MNRIFKRIWNASRGLYVAVSEIAQTNHKGAGRTAVAITMATVLAGASVGVGAKYVSTHVWDETFTQDNIWSKDRSDESIPLKLFHTWHEYLGDTSFIHSYIWETGWQPTTSLVLGEGQNIIFRDAIVEMTTGTFTNKGNFYSGVAGFTKTVSGDTGSETTTEEWTSNNTFEINGTDAVFNNSGVITATGGNTYDVFSESYSQGAGFKLNAGTLTNTGTFTATGATGSSAKGFEQQTGSTMVNEESGTIIATGGSYNNSCGMVTNGSFTNNGTITAQGGSTSYTDGFNQSNGTLTNTGTITATGGTNTSYAFGFNLSGGNLINTGTISTSVISGNGGDSLHQSGGTLTNKSGGIINAIGGVAQARAFWHEAGTVVNEAGGIINAIGGSAESSPWSAYGYYLCGGALNNIGTLNVTGGSNAWIYGLRQSGGDITNTGTINLVAPVALNAFYGSVTQTEETALISGNLLSFADVPISSSSSSTKFAIGASDLSALLEAESDTKVSLAKFLTSSITGGTLHITDDDLNANSQQMIKDAIYGAGVGSPVNITFGGTGDRDICGAKKKVIDVAHVKAFLKTAGNEGSVLYQDDLNETTALSFGTGTNDLGSVGFRSVGSKSVSIAGGKELTLLGDGTKIAGDATGAVTVADGTLKLGLNHEKTISQKQGGLLGSVSVGAGGKVSIADVSGLFQIKDTLSLSETGRVQNDGTLSVGTLDVSGTRTSLLNNGTMTVAEVQAEGSDRSTIQNAGILAVDSSKNLSIQNKGTLVANAVQIGVTERIVNGGTLVTDSFVSDGAYAGRNEAQLVIGTTAKILYLKNNLDVAKALYEAGQTLPASVVTALKEAGLVTASASTNEVALMSLAQNDEDAQEVAHAPRRAMAPRAEAPRSETPNDAQEVRDETQDVGEAPQSEAQDVAQESHPEPQDVAEAPRADAPSAHEDEPREQERNENESDAHAPTRSIQDLIREANMWPRVGQSLVGALTVASEETASRTLASVESQAQDWTHGLWASADYVRSDFDAYENTRSGLLFGLQASGETYTIGGALIAGKGKAKTDNMASQNTKDIGGTLYVGLRFGNAHVSVAGLFSHHEGKVGDTKRTAKTYGSSVKVGVDSEFGGLTLTPYAGWRVIAVDHEDASDRTVTHQFPLGLKATGQFKVGGWQFKPTLDVSYIAQSGDKRVRTAGTGLESVIAGQYAVSYQAGLWAEKGNLSLGVTYRGTSGDNGTQGNGIQANLRYTF